MKASRLLLAVALVAFLSGLAYVSQANESSGVKMTRAAESLITSLNPGQQARVLLPFADKERLNWHFVPLQNADKTPKRRGVRLEEMNNQQRDATLALLRAGTSPD